VDVLDLAVVATMGSTSNKRAVKNMQTVRYHGFAILLINAIFVAWRLYWNRGTATWGLYASLLPTSVAYGISYRLVMQHAEDGSELFQKGLVEYCWDIIWVTMVTQLLACVTDWAWALYSLVRLCSGSPARRLCKYLEYVRPLTGLHMAQALRKTLVSWDLSRAHGYRPHLYVCVCVRACLWPLPPPLLDLPDACGPGTR